MRAVVLDADGIRLDPSRDLPRSRSGETLVRVLRAGICETDLQLMQGYMGFEGILGHEFVGVAETGRLVGQRVVGEINCACGDCSTCREGRRNHCPQRTVLGILGHDGAFADFVAVPDENLLPVPERVETDVAVFTEPLAAACRILEQVELSSMARVTVLGDGRLGNLCAQVLARHTGHMRVVGKHSEKLALLEAVDIETCLLEDVESSRDCDVVVDCTGSASGIETAMQLVRPQGTIVLKTTVAGKPSLSLAPVVIDEVRVVGSRCGPFDRALDLLARQEIDVLPLISGRFPLDDTVAALEHARTNPVLKLLLDVSDG